jgi:cell division protein FtsB
MSTRRPKVPRAARPAGGNGSGPHGSDHGASGDGVSGGKVIRADFNGGKDPAPERPVSERHPAPGRAARPPAARAKPTPSEARAAERQELSEAIRQPGGKRPASPEPKFLELHDDNAAPIPAKAFSGRMLALAVVLVTITVLLAPSVRVFIEQRSEIAALQQDISTQQERQDKLERELARWDDPAYIKQQARDRIFYVMPGETRYLVTGAEGLDDSEEHASEAAPAELPWVDALWDSVKRAATDKPAQD